MSCLTKDMRLKSLMGQSFLSDVRNRFELRANDLHRISFGRSRHQALLGQQKQPSIVIPRGAQHASIGSILKVLYAQDD